jgi:hypothetical protein
MNPDLNRAAILLRPTNPKESRHAGNPHAALCIDPRRRLAGCVQLASALRSPSSPPSSTAPASTIPASTIPAIPAPVAVTVNARSSALLVLDINTAVCQPNPACTATVPAIASLVQKARAAKIPVVYSTTLNPAGPPPVLAGVAPQPGEPS